MSINGRYLNMSHDEAFLTWKRQEARLSHLLRLEKPTPLQIKEMERLRKSVAELECVLAAWRNQLRLF